MKKILQTPRIYLRELTQDDYRDLCDILQDRETMVAYEHAFSHEEVQQWLDRQLERYAEYGFGLWAVIDHVTGAFVGQAGLTMQNTGVAQELEIGYLLKREHWHKGYAMEAAIACRDYAFQVLNQSKVTSIIRDTNAASRRVAERVGMKKEKQFIKHYYCMDMPHDVYAIYREGR